ncbi:ExbD/TolR family protein [Teredinibacter waterburyi]|jgi:Biopolymer transport protein|uniref:ExbD/TolR family protein n=1 Tax=Teredinibacter waterburyi TaxID=1500538 RepID=UPI00165EF3F3|nr:biopolymer transporter ExbD [Teredinibacter waterburyi]
MKFARKKHLQETVELNITAFMNLMVILVPFLLITAVFSRMTVLELNLPALDAAQKENPDQEIKLQLQVVVQADQLTIQDGNLGVLKQVPFTGETTDWNLFADVLIEIKRRFPDEKGIALLLDSNVPYKVMIQVMDRVKSADVVNITSLQTVELFPNISIGDAPTLSDVNAANSSDSPADKAVP